MQVSTLMPGLLVSLKTNIIGNVSYSRRQLEADHLTEEGQRRAKWETERTIDNPAERKKASEVRSAARAKISRVCSSSTFGLLCPEAKRIDLDEAIKEARTMVDEFNASATLTRVGVYVIAGRIAADDVEAVRAINSEVRDLLQEMEAGLGRLDVRAVRVACNKAKSIGRVLSPDAAARIKDAIDAARDVAKKIVKAGESAAVVIDTAAIRRIADSRTAFLDLDEAAEVIAPKARARAVDLEPEKKPTPAKSPRKSATQPQLEV